MYNYVTLDGCGMVVGVSTLSGIVTAPNMVRVANPDTALLGKHYDPETGNFE